MNKQYASPSIAVIEVESNAMLLNISDDHVSLYRMMGDEGDLVKQEGGGTQSTSERSLWDETWSEIVGHDYKVLAPAFMYELILYCVLIHLTSI